MIIFIDGKQLWGAPGVGGAISKPTIKETVLNLEIHLRPARNTVQLEKGEPAYIRIVADDGAIRDLVVTISEGEDYPDISTGFTGYLLRGLIEWEQKQSAFIRPRNLRMNYGQAD